MTPKCALQIRSTFGTDILMQKTGSFWGREPRSSTLPKKMMKEDEKSHMDMQTLWGRWGWSYWKTTIQEENLLKWSHVTKHFEIEGHTSMWSANLGFWLKGARPIVTLASNAGDVKHLSQRTRDSVKGGSLTRRKFQRYEEVERDRIWREFSWIQKNDGKNSRPKAPKPHDRTPEHRIKKKCNREQKKDVVTSWGAVTSARGDQSTLQVRTLQQTVDEWEEVRRDKCPMGQGAHVLRRPTDVPISVFRRRREGPCRSLCVWQKRVEENKARSRKERTFCRVDFSWIPDAQDT